MIHSLVRLFFCITFFCIGISYSYGDVTCKCDGGVTINRTTEEVISGDPDNKDFTGNCSCSDGKYYKVQIGQHTEETEKKKRYSQSNSSSFDTPERSNSDSQQQLSPQVLQNNDDIIETEEREETDPSSSELTENDQFDDSNDPRKDDFEQGNEPSYPEGEESEFSDSAQEPDYSQEPDPTEPYDKDNYDDGDTNIDPYAPDDQERQSQIQSRSPRDTLDDEGYDRPDSEPRENISSPRDDLRGYDPGYGDEVRPRNDRGPAEFEPVDYNNPRRPVVIPSNVRSNDRGPNPGFMPDNNYPMQQPYQQPAFPNNYNPDVVPNFNQGAPLMPNGYQPYYDPNTNQTYAIPTGPTEYAVPSYNEGAQLPPPGYGVSIPSLMTAPLATEPAITPRLPLYERPKEMTKKAWDSLPNCKIQ